MKELMSMMVCLFLSALLGVMVATGWVLQKTTGIVISCSPRLPERGSKNQAYKVVIAFVVWCARFLSQQAVGRFSKTLAVGDGAKRFFRCLTWPL